MVKEREEEQNKKEKSINETEIINRIKGGETELFANIIDMYQKKIVILASRYIYNDDDVDDAVQEIFIKIYDNLDKFRFKSSFGTWVYRIAINHCFELKRKQSSKKNIYLLIDNDTQTDNLISDIKTPERNFEDKELAKRINEIINRNLSKKQKAVFMLKYLDDLPIKDIAYILDMREGTVKTHLSRSYDKIREELEKEYYEK